MSKLVLDQFRQLLSESRQAVVFTGAGISTESGIPDFRSPGGIWTKYKPIYFHEYKASEAARRESWRRKFKIDETVASAKPNAGHRAIATLIEDGLVNQVITQNIDGLHQASGIPDELIIELHGNTTYATCLDCGSRYELQSIKKAFLEDQTLPECEDCSGLVKTATISFGQPMPKQKLFAAQQASINCDLFIAIGSSLVVFPAAALLPLAKDNDARVVILNRDETEFDRMADLIIHAEIGSTLSALIN